MTVTEEALERAQEVSKMIAQLMLGIVAMVMRRADFEPALPDRKSGMLEATDPWWKPTVEVALGGLIVVVALGARLALAYGWFN
jgi:hypothetical protein